MDEDFFFWFESDIENVMDKIEGSEDPGDYFGDGIDYGVEEPEATPTPAEVAQDAQPTNADGAVKVPQQQVQGLAAPPSNPQSKAAEVKPVPQSDAKDGFGGDAMEEQDYYDYLTDVGDEASNAQSTSVVSSFTGKGAGQGGNLISANEVGDNQGGGSSDGASAAAAAATAATVGAVSGGVVGAASGTSSSKKSSTSGGTAGMDDFNDIFTGLAEEDQEVLDEILGEETTPEGMARIKIKENGENPNKVKKERREEYDKLVELFTKKKSNYTEASVASLQDGEKINEDVVNEAGFGVLNRKGYYRQIHPSTNKHNSRLISKLREESTTGYDGSIAQKMDHVTNFGNFHKDEKAYPKMQKYSDNINNHGTLSGSASVDNELFTGWAKEDMEFLRSIVGTEEGERIEIAPSGQVAQGGKGFAATNATKTGTSTGGTTTTTTTTAPAAGGTTTASGDEYGVNGKLTITKPAAASRDAFLTGGGEEGFPGPTYANSSVFYPQREGSGMFNAQNSAIVRATPGKSHTYGSENQLEELEMDDLFDEIFGFEAEDEEWDDTEEDTYPESEDTEDDFGGDDDVAGADAVADDGLGDEIPEEASDDFEAEDEVVEPVDSEGELPYNAGKDTLDELKEQSSPSDSTSDLQAKIPQSVQPDRLNSIIDDLADEFDDISGDDADEEAAYFDEHAADFDEIKEENEKGIKESETEFSGAGPEDPYNEEIGGPRYEDPDLPIHPITAEVQARIDDLEENETATVVVRGEPVNQNEEINKVENPDAVTEGATEDYDWFSASAAEESFDLFSDMSMEDAEQLLDILGEEDFKKWVKDKVGQAKEWAKSKVKSDSGDSKSESGDKKEKGGFWKRLTGFFKGKKKEEGVEGEKKESKPEEPAKQEEKKTEAKPEQKPEEKKPAAEPTKKEDQTKGESPLMQYGRYLESQKKEEPKKEEKKEDKKTNTELKPDEETKRKGEDIVNKIKGVSNNSGTDEKKKEKTDGDANSIEDEFLVGWATEDIEFLKSLGIESDEEELFDDAVDQADFDEPESAEVGADPDIVAEPTEEPDAAITGTTNAEPDNITDDNPDVIVNPDFYEPTGGANDGGADDGEPGGIGNVGALSQKVPVSDQVDIDTDIQVTDGEDKSSFTDDDIAILSAAAESEEPDFDMEDEEDDVELEAGAETEEVSESEDLDEEAPVEDAGAELPEEGFSEGGDVGGGDIPVSDYRVYADDLEEVEQPEGLSTTEQTPLDSVSQVMDRDGQGAQDTEETFELVDSPETLNSVMDPLIENMDRTPAKGQGPPETLAGGDPGEQVDIEETEISEKEDMIAEDVAAEAPEEADIETEEASIAGDEVEEEEAEDEITEGAEEGFDGYTNLSQETSTKHYASQMGAALKSGDDKKYKAAGQRLDYKIKSSAQRKARNAEVDQDRSGDNGKLDTVIKEIETSGRLASPKKKK